MTESRLKSIVDRIERLEERQKALLAAKRDIYTEAKKADPDLNTKALRRVIAERRMPDREQIEAAMHNYRVALGMAVNDVANGATLRQAADRHGVSKSAVHRSVPREENSQEGQTAEAEPPPTDVEKPQEEQPAETPRQTAEGKSAVADAENMQEAQPPEAPHQAAAGEPSVSDADSLLEIPDFLRRSPK